MPELNSHQSSGLHPQNQTLKAMQGAVSGQVPSNDQVDSIITQAQQTIESQKANPNVTMKGETVLQKTSNVLEATKDFVQEKNEGDLIQNLAKHSKEAAEAMKTDVNVSPMDTDGAKKKAKSAGQSLHSLGMRLAKSQELRTQFLNFIEVLKQVFYEKVDDNKQILVGNDHNQQQQHQQQQHVKCAQNCSGKEECSTSDKAKEQVKDTAQDAKKAFDNSSSLKDGFKNAGNVIKGAVDNAKDSIDIELSDEQAKKLTDEAEKIIEIITKKPEFKEAFCDVRDLVEFLFVEAEDKMEDIKEDLQNSNKLDSSSKKVEEDLKALADKFVGKENLDKFINDTKALALKIKNDQNLKQFCSKVSNYFQYYFQQNVNNLKQNKEQMHKDLQALIKEARFLSNKYKYSKEYERLFNDVERLVKDLKNDDCLNNLQKAGDSLVGEFTFKDVHGNVRVDFDALKEVQKAIVPILIDQLDNVPIPRIEHIDEEVNLILDNMVFSARDILPDRITIKSNMDSVIDLKNLDKSTTDTKMRIELREMRTEFKDVKFYLKKNKFPKIEDAGTFDAKIAGGGANLYIELDIDRDRNGDVSFKGSKVDFDLKDLEVKFQDDVHHPFLLKFGTTLGKGLIKEKVRSAAVENVTKVVNDITKALNHALKRIKSQVQSGGASVADQIVQAVTH